MGSLQSLPNIYQCVGDMSTDPYIAEVSSLLTKPSPQPQVIFVIIWLKNFFENVL